MRRTPTSTVALIAGALALCLAVPLSAQQFFPPTPTNPGTSPIVLNVKSAPYNAFGDTQQVADGTWTGTGKTITSATAKFVAGDVGKTIYCNKNAVNDYPPTTISTFNSSSSVTVAGNAANSTTGSEYCVWGHDDTAAFQAATTAAKVVANYHIGGATFFAQPLAPIIYAPLGGYMFKDCPFCFLVVSGNEVSPSIKGDGRSSTIFFLRPDYANTAGVIRNNGGFVIDSWGAYATFSGFTIDGDQFLFTPPNSSTGPAVFITSNANATDIGCVVDMTANNGCLTFSGNQQNITNITATAYNVTGNRSVACVFTAGDSSYLAGSYCGNSWQSVKVSGINGLTTGSKFTLRDNIFDECGSNGSPCTTITGSTDIFLEYNGIYGAVVSSLNEPLDVDGTSDVVLIGNNIGAFNSGSPGSGLQIDSGGRVRATGNRFRSYGTGTEVNGAAGSIYIDMGGNIYSHGNVERTGSAAFAGGIVPQASLTHTTNTCNLIIAFANSVTDTLCNGFLDQDTLLLRIKASSNVTTACASAPVVTLSNGTNSATLTLTSGASTWDSGALTTTWATGTTMTMTIATNTCATPPTNLAVSYTYSSIGAH